MGQTLGFISFGHVARAVAKRAAPFGLRMMAYDPYIEELVMSDARRQPASLTRAAAARRTSSPCMRPATPGRHHMMKEQHFRQMKPTAMFINTGRGPTVDEAALIKALQEGWIAGAGLDVLETEPPVHNNPLLRMDNVILTAHVASASARFDRRAQRRVGARAGAGAGGQMAASCVNPAVLRTPACAAGSPSAWAAARTARRRHP